MLLYSNSAAKLDLFGTIASVIIAAFAVLQFSYLIFIQAKKERKRNEKEWFHRLVIEPKINEIYGFFEETENKIGEIKGLMSNDLDIKVLLDHTDDLKKDIIYRFRRNFVYFIGAVDYELSQRIQNLLDDFLDNLINRLFSENFTSEDSKKIERDFIEVKRRIISLLYKWNN